MSPPANTSDLLDMQNVAVNGQNPGTVDLEKHAQLISTYMSDFDLVDIGSRQEKISADLQDVRNILVTGGAGFM
jgi:hypothetical protein